MHISTLAMAPTKNMIEQMIGKNNTSQNNSKKESTNMLTKTQNNKVESTNDKELYVKKWVDYSSKYGLGYLLTNGNSGVFFNDCTKIIYDPVKDYFEYIERKNSERVDVVSAYTFNNYPKDLHKKVTLLLHFRSYLEGIRAFTTVHSENPTQVPLANRN